MDKPQFVHLHLHTEYSLLDGAIKIDELINQARQYEMPAVAITDHGNLFGIVEFFKSAQKAHIKPIIGCEVYVAPQSRFDKTKINKDAGMPEEASYHLTLLVENDKGYKNLTRIVTLSYLEGFYYKPRIDMELLRQYNEGLIALSGCLKGEIPYNIVYGNIERAENTAKQFKELFGDNFYLEIQSNGLDEQKIANNGIMEISKKLDIPVVATNDCHYLYRSDAKAHEILLCIQTGKTIKDEKRLKFQSDDFYFKSPEEMYLAFKDIPSALKNTLEIAEKCNFKLRLGDYRLPKYTVPEGYTDEDYLRKIAEEGLYERFNGKVPDAYKDRFYRELEVITNMGFASYFLIVWDFINYARKNNIPVGPGRGSAAGSLVAYALKITDIDPIKYGLIFERFLNPERISMPDIDVDFCRDRREDVIQYVSEKYGKEKVAHIITFGTMASKAVVRDVGRAFNLPYSEVDKVAKMIPFACRSLTHALEIENKLKELYNRDEKVRELIGIALRLEGLARHASQHAAGIVISPEPIQDFMPLYKNPGEDIVTTQFDMKAVEEIGLLKFDFLGLKTLTIIDNTIKYAEKLGKSINLSQIPLDDQETYKLLSSGQTTGVFQLESRGMRDLLQRIQPEKFEDLIALVALYRPGPLGSGMVDDFIKRKKGLIPIEYEIPELEDILNETYGVILYQEQVMKIANIVAGFTMGQADILRKAMGKKNPELMSSLKEDFVNGAIKRGISENKAEALFNKMAAFGEYGFNKSHSAAYAYLAYQTAYLKTHFPVEFFAANLSQEINDTVKIVKFINECRLYGIEIKGPDINESDRAFKVSGKSIRFGLEAVKGVGVSALESILKEREKKKFTSMKDFITRVDGKKVNKKVIESLIKAGAFDSLYSSSPNHARALAMRELINNKGNSTAGALFFYEEKVEPWDTHKLLREEKASLGFYLSGHPMQTIRKLLKKRNVTPIAELVDQEDFLDDINEEGVEVNIAGIVEEIKSKAKDKGITGYMTVEDETGRLEVVIYPELFKKYRDVLKEGNKILLKGILFKAYDSTKFLARDLEELKDTDLKFKYEISLKCEDSESAIDILKQVREVLTEQRNGEGGIYICLIFQDYCVKILSPLEPGIDFETKLQKIKDCHVRIL